MKNWRQFCLATAVGVVGLTSSLAHAALEIPALDPAVAVTVTPTVVVTPGPGATATTSLTFEFLSDYDFNSINLEVGYDAGLLQFNRGASTVSLFAPAASVPSVVESLPDAVAFFAPATVSETNDLANGSYILNAFSIAGYPLPQGSKLVLNGVFNLTSSFNASTSTDVTMSVYVAGPALDSFQEESFLGLQTTVSAVPEPETWMLLLGGLGLIASRVRRASTRARTDSEAASA